MGEVERRLSEEERRMIRRAEVAEELTELVKELKIQLEQAAR